MKKLNPKIKKIELKEINNNLGKLITFNDFLKKNIFKPKNIFLINGKKNSTRGHHAHKKSTQILLCIKGKIEIKCIYKKKSKKFILQKTNIGLLVPPFVWSEIKFLYQNSQLLVVSNYQYIETEYIRKYEDFLKIYNE